MARSVEKFNKMDVLPEAEANEDGSGLDKVFDSALSGMVDFSTTTRMRCAVHSMHRMHSMHRCIVCTAYTAVSY